MPILSGFGITAITAKGRTSSPVGRGGLLGVCITSGTSAFTGPKGVARSTRVPTITADGANLSAEGDLGPAGRTGEEAAVTAIWFKGAV